jgi:hypothetical protein
VKTAHAKPRRSFIVCGAPQGVWRDVIWPIDGYCLLRYDEIASFIQHGANHLNLRRKKYELFGDVADMAQGYNQPQ